MGWTWKAPTGVNSILQLYPSLANIPALIERWPSLRDAIDKQRAAEAIAAGVAPVDPIPLRETPPPKID